jgi:cyanophycinase-like exopeptidase
MARLLVLMGSGETAPTMVKPHRALFERLGPDPVPAVVLDTPYGFQENADDISARAVEYFAQSVGRPVEVARLRRRESDDPVQRERALAQVAAARWVFAGPGSPTYSLRQWRGGEVPALLADKLAHGGCVVFSSAAALTLGRYSVPVYEIYKSGEDPAWADGLDLVAPILGPDVAVIPHFDNAEGGNHDTRYCYLGERRLRIMEGQLPPEGWVLGIDEHTGLILDLDQASATVVGIGSVTVRRHGTVVTLPAGSALKIDELTTLWRGADSPAAATPAVPEPAAPAVDGGGSSDATFLHGEVRRLSEAFDAAISAGDVDRAVRAALELDDTLQDWSGDTTESDATDRGRAALRRMITRLGQLAHEGVRDPRSVVEPFVDALLALRASARAERRFADADAVRDALVATGVEVRDTPEGTKWDLIR